MPDALPEHLPAFPGGAARFVGAYPEAAMSIRLQGLDTVFLPFNENHDGGAGNPVNLNGDATACLWDEVCARDP